MLLWLELCVGVALYVWPLSIGGCQRFSKSEGSEGE